MSGKPTTTAEKFWTRVDRSGGPDACWLWTGPPTKAGYGELSWQGKRIYAHRLAFTLIVGPIPHGMNVCHNCPGGDNPLCCNPAHHFLGTQRDNMHDMIRKGRAGKPNPHPRRGDDSPAAKLTASIVRDLRARYAKGGVLYRELATEYGVTLTAVYSAINRVTWKHIE